MPYSFVLITIVGVISGQLLLKKGLSEIGYVPNQIFEYIPFFLRAFTSPYVLCAILCILVASLSWLVALSKASLSSIYPLMGMNFVLVALFSWIFLKDSISVGVWVGILLVSAGVFLVVRG